MQASEIKQNLKGNIVPVPGQFNDDLSLNLPAYRDHVNFLLDRGVRSFYLALSASEFDYMTLEERIAVTRTVAACLTGDSILISQAVGGQWLDEQIDEAKRLLDNGAHAIVISPRGIKEGGKFFSSFYSRSSYEPSRHNDYYLAYMERFAGEVQAPLIYHDKPFKSGKGLSLAGLEAILSIDYVAGLKAHVADPLILHGIYQRFGSKVACFDGFGKTQQFWSLQWGAQARHTCWSWFDPDSDQRFTQAIFSGNLTEAVKIVNSEWPVAEAIGATGFQGYKYIMKLVGLPAGPVRIPGEELNETQRKMIEDAIHRIGLPATSQK